MADAPEPMLRVPLDFEVEFPDCRALATESFINFGLVAGALHSELQRLLEAHGIPSMAAFNVLAILAGSETALAPSVIAERMLVTRPTMSGVLDSLDRRGLVRRIRDRSDSRKRLVEPSGKGLRAIRRVLPVVHRWEAQVMSCLTTEQQRELLRILATLQAQMRASAPGADLHVPDQL